MLYGITLSNSLISLSSGFIAARGDPTLTPPEFASAENAISLQHLINGGPSPRIGSVTNPIALSCTPKTMTRRRPIAPALATFTMGILGLALMPPEQALLTTSFLGMLLGMIGGGTNFQELATAAETDSEAVKTLYRMASEGEQEAIAALAQAAVINPQAVGALYDLAQAGFHDIRYALLGLDIGRLTRGASFTHHNVYALSHLAEIGHEGAREVLKNLDVTTYAQEAKTDPYAVYALSHLARAGNAAAHYVIDKFDIRAYVQKAKKDPHAVHALSHLAKAGHTSAGENMKTLDVRGLAQTESPDTHTLYALRLLIEMENESAVVALAEIAGSQEEAMIVLRGLAAGGHTLVFRVLARVSETSPHAVYALSHLAKDNHEPSRDLLKRLDVANYAHDTETLKILVEAGNENAVMTLAIRSRLHTDTARAFQDLVTQGNENIADLLIEMARTHSEVVSALGLMAKAGHKNAIPILAQAGETNREAVAVLSGLAAKGHKKAFAALCEMAQHSDSAVDFLRDQTQTGKRVAFRALVKAAGTNPYAVFALNNLAESGHMQARNVMRTLDVTVLSRMAETNHPQAVAALGFLARRGNQAAIQPYVTAARAHPQILINTNLRSMCCDETTKNLPAQLDLDMEIYVSAIQQNNFDTAELIDALAELVKRGNASAFRIIVKAAETNLWALWTLDRLKSAAPSAREAMKTLSVRAAVESAKKQPLVVYSLLLLAMEGNEGAKALMRGLDVTDLVALARSSSKEASRSFSALRSLAMTGNEGAFTALTLLAKTSPAAIKELRSIARGINLIDDNELYQANARKIIDDMNKKTTIPPEGE